MALRETSPTLLGGSESKSSKTNWKGRGGAREWRRHAFGRLPPGWGAEEMVPDDVEGTAEDAVLTLALLFFKKERSMSVMWKHKP